MRGREIHDKNVAQLKAQIVDPQAKLLAAQDRIAELQRQLLDLRAERQTV